jgi:hypothetical protein
MVKPPLRTKSIGFKVSEEEYAQLETAAQASGQTLGEWCREAAVLGCANGEPQAASGPGGADFAIFIWPCRARLCQAITVSTRWSRGTRPPHACRNS